METIWVAAMESSYLWLPATLFSQWDSQTEVVANTKQDFLFRQKKKEELVAEKERDVCVREAYSSDPAALFCLATALHMLTYLLHTIIRVYITLLCSAQPAPVIGFYTWKRL